MEHETPFVLQYILPWLWVACYLLLAVLSAISFRLTASGILMWSGFGLLALRHLVFNVIIILRFSLSSTGFNTIWMILGFVLMLMIAVGIALIPLSLRRLDATAA